MSTTTGASLEIVTKRLVLRADIKTHPGLVSVIVSTPANIFSYAGKGVSR